MKSEKQLYQWDVNQYLTELQPEAQFVDYPMGNEVIRIETEGKRCRIPDEFLQTAGFKASCLTQGFAFIDEELVNIKPGECNGRGYYFRFKAPAERLRSKMQTNRSNWRCRMQSAGCGN